MTDKDYSNIIRRFSANEIDAKRQEYYEKLIIPPVEAVFKASPSTQSVIIYVAQYYCDEALDDVHFRHVWSTTQNPDLAAFEQRLKVGIESGDYEDDLEDFIEGKAGFKTIWSEINANSDKTMSTLLYRTVDFASSGFRYRDNISLFSAFCHDMWHQEYDLFTDPYRPLLKLTRTENNSARIELLGQMYRPWLDGIAPSTHETFDPDIYTTGALITHERANSTE